jgi:hypothetical protein
MTDATLIAELRAKIAALEAEQDDRAKYLDSVFSAWDREQPRHDNFHWLLQSTTLLAAIERKMGRGLLLRDGTPAPTHPAYFDIGERITLRGYEFLVSSIGVDFLLLVPIGPKPPSPEVKP